MGFNAFFGTWEENFISSLKKNENYQIPLFEMYYYTNKYSHLSDEELKEHFCTQLIPSLHQLPKVSQTLTFKGKLRISWNFDVKYDKNIDLIFFPEDNPYINYAILYAKDFSKKINKEDPYYMDKKLDEINVLHDINYNFVKEILSKSNLNKIQQDKFFQVRFGSLFIPVEIEFKWYSLHFYNANNSYVLSQLNPTMKSLLHYAQDTSNDERLILLGIIHSYKILSKDISLNFPAHISSTYEYESKNIAYYELFAPLPTAVLATTQTNIDDFIINVRDKPSVKDGKIITQLISQMTKIPDDFYTDEEEVSVSYAYKKFETTGFDLLVKDKKEYQNPLQSFKYYHHKMKQSYFEKENLKLINPLNSNKYLILVWDIWTNDWAKVWVLKMITEDDFIVIDNEKIYYEEYQQEFDNWEANIAKFIKGSYTQVFLETPSKLKLYEGFIHTNGLKFLASFTNHYIERP